MQLHAAPGGGVQVAGAGVVAQAGPVRHDLVGTGRGQVGQGGKAFDEALEIADDGGDLGLLQHHLRQPHPVGRSRLLPGQVVAAVLVEPGQQGRGEGGGLAHAGLVCPFSRREKVPRRGG